MSSSYELPAMDDKNKFQSNCEKLSRCDAHASDISDILPPWCYDPKSSGRIAPADCVARPSKQEAAISHLQKNVQEPHDKTHSSRINPLNNKCIEAVGNHSVIGREAAQAFVENSQANSEQLLHACYTTPNGTSFSVDDTVVKTKARRVPSTPTLIVSDTSTGQDNCVLESAVLPNHFFDGSKKDVPGSKETFDSKQSSLDDTDSCISTENMTESENNSPLEIQSVHEHSFLSPRRSCDSAYGSSMETALTVAQYEASPASSITDNDVVMDSISSGTSLSMSSAEDSPNHTSYGTSLSVCLPSKNSSEFSSTSSIASDSATDILCGAEDGGPPCNLQIDKENIYLRKLSSSSTFSLRSSLSFEESEEDFASGDDSGLHISLARRNSKIKAQNSWTKLRRMVIWSPFMQSFKRKYPWVQLAGHAGNFQPGAEGCILKKYVEREAVCLERLTADPSLKEFAPTFHDIVHQSDETYTRMQDLLMPFDSPSLMDCKMGIRTYLEDELIKAKVKPRLRHDMYLKMVEISPDEPTPQERKLKAVTKPRYMQWREHVSSTSNLGFRIEGIKKSNKEPSKDYKLTKSFDQVSAAFNYFIDSNAEVLEKYIERLKQMRAALETSDFFHSHEAIGSSLLFVHDHTGLANIWMIDFGKTSRLPEGQKLDHRKEWVEGNREDGYLFGMDNMVLLFENMLQGLSSEPELDKTLSSKEDDSEPLEDETMISRVNITITAPVPPPHNRRQAVKRQLAQSLTDDDFASAHGHDVTTGDVSERVFVERTS